MPRPIFNKQPITRMGDDGTLIRGVEFMFGLQGEAGNYRDTLWEDWADRSEEEQIAEMEQRYDNWLSAVNAPQAPIDPEQVLSDIDAQLLELQRQRLQLEQQKLEAMEAILSPMPEE